MPQYPAHKNIYIDIFRSKVSPNTITMEESDYDYDSYDENDDELMESVSEAIAKQVVQVFPPLDELTLKWAPIHEISDTQLNKFAKLVGNLDTFYRNIRARRTGCLIKS